MTSHSTKRSSSLASRVTSKIASLGSMDSLIPGSFNIKGSEFDPIYRESKENVLIVVGRRIGSSRGWDVKI